MVDSKWKFPCAKNIYTIIGKLLARFPILILIIVTTLAITLSWIGVAQNGIPEFGDPYLGFQTRFTPIANRLVTLDNFRLELNRLNILENYPGERIGEKETRRRRDGSSRDNALCSDFPTEEYGRVALELKGTASTSALSRETLSLICYFQQLVSLTRSYESICELDESGRCCLMWSLPNYVSQYSNKSRCVDIHEEDVNRFREGVHTCHSFYSNSTQNEDCLFRRSACPTMCHHGQIIHSALEYTIDRDSLQKNVTQYTMVILPVPKSSKHQAAMESFQEEIWNLGQSLPREIASVVGYDFGGKNSLFETYLVSDLRYVALASVIIFSIVLIFTKSLFVTVISYGMLILSLGISYFLYKNVYGIPYFPFMNMLVTIIILGIGTDATLIVSCAWRRASACSGSGHGRARREFVMIETLSDTTVTLVITTCTTAGAFFASLMSSITTIRCFSIFAGTTIITSFVLLYIMVPISLDCSERFWNYFTSLFPMDSQSKVAPSAFRVPRITCSIQKSRKFFSKLRGFTSSTMFWTFSFLICATLVTISSFTVFLFPGLELPKSEQFQLLSGSHPVELFDRLISPSFGGGTFDDVTEVTDQKLTVYLIWGLLPEDNGHGLDPTNTGKLEFDPNFALASPESQKWMRKLCRRIHKLPYYDPIENDRVGLALDSCFMDTFVSWMKRDCQFYTGSEASCCNVSKFPYEKETLEKCMGFAARDVYRTPSLYFHPDIAGPKFFVSGASKEDGVKGFNHVGTFTVRIKTNFTYSVLHEKMDNIYGEFEQSFENILKDAPAQLQNGFFVSSHFDFYDLQKSLIQETWTSLLLSIGLCFIFLWISSRSIKIALGAAVTIFAIVLVTSAVMIEFFNWKLGVFESIAATVAVGLSDFTAHHSIEFSKEKSVVNMTKPTFVSALATVIMGLCMYIFSSVLVYEQIGSFFFVLVITSWIYSVFFLSPILIFLDNVTSRMKGFCSGQRLNKSTTPDDAEDHDSDDVHSHSDLIMENVSVTQAQKVERKPSNAMMETWKQLKKFRQETPV